MNKFIRNSLAGLLMLLPVSNALSQNTVERIQSTVKEHTFTRANIFYTLPDSIEGYSFTEIYDNKKFFGKTTLSKNILPNIDVRMRFEYGTEYTQLFAGIGVTTSGKNYIISTHLLQGIKTNDQVIGFYASYNPIPQIKLSAFSDLSIRNTHWGYGEVNAIGKIHDKILLGYNVGLYSNNNLLPCLEHRITMRVEL